MFQNVSTQAWPKSRKKSPPPTFYVFITSALSHLSKAKEYYFSFPNPTILVKIYLKK